MLSRDDNRSTVLSFEGGLSCGLLSSFDSGPAVVNADRGQSHLLRQTYLSSGGLMSAEELLQALRGRIDQPLSALARWLACREIVCFECFGTTFIPMFQFGQSPGLPASHVAPIVRELVDVFDDWEVAHWFASSNGWLGNRAPVAVVNNAAQEVLQAARAVRFALRG